MFTVEIFNRKYSLRKPSNLNSPKISDLELLELPKFSIFHYLPHGDELGPAKDEYLFRNIDRVIPIYHVLDITSKEGNPRLLPGQPLESVRKFHQSNRVYKRVRELADYRTEALVPFVINYSLMDKRYKYIKNPLAGYNKWYNTTATILKQMNDVCSISDSNQYLIIKLPTILPSVSLLRQATNNFTLSIINKFSEDEQFLILSFWKWLSASRDDKLLNLIEKKNYSRINFIIQDTGKWTVFNLGTLNSLRKATEEERLEDADAPKKGFEPKKLQLLFIRYLMNITSVRTNVEDVKEVKEDKVTTNKVVVDTDIPKDTTLINQLTPKPINRLEQLTKQYQHNLNLVEQKTIDDGLEEDDEDDTPILEDNEGTFQLTEEEDRELEEEIDTFNSLTEQQEANEKEPIVLLKEDKIKTPTDGVVSKAEELASIGMMTPAEFRRFDKLANTYKTLKYPDSDKTLEEMATITKDEVTFEKVKPYKDLPTIQDKSMLSSTVESFTKEYVTNVLEKDIASSILSIQNAGIAVSNVEKETIEDATGKYHNYKVKLHPVEGTTSTIWMKIPHVDEQGNMRVNNVKYKRRNQRVDKFFYPL